MLKDKNYVTKTPKGPSKGSSPKGKPQPKNLTNITNKKASGRKK